MGYLSVVSDGQLGLGKVGQNDFEMMRRQAIQKSAEEYVFGSWDLWVKGLTATLTMGEDYIGNLDLSDKSFIHTWKFEIHGHKVTSSNFPGTFNMVCSADGTLSVITVSFMRGK